jgi:hypothetical protein
MSVASKTTWQFKPLDLSIDCTEIDPGPPEISRQQILHSYRATRLDRISETRPAALYGKDRIVGAVYPGRGPEAIAAGRVGLLREARR